MVWEGVRETGSEVQERVAYLLLVQRQVLPDVAGTRLFGHAHDERDTAEVLDCHDARHDPSHWHQGRGLRVAGWARSRHCRHDTGAEQGV